MNTINKITTCIVFCLFIGFTACVDEVSYTPAETPENAQVFFPSSLPSTVSLSTDMSITSYNIELRRYIKKNAVNVSLTVVNENPDIFTIPTSVSFAAGAETANITISYDPELLEFGDFKPLRISVSDQNLTSPYGNSYYEFTAGIPEPWKSLGDAEFSMIYWFDFSYKVELQQHMLEPNRYRLVDPFSEALIEEEYVPAMSKGNQSPYLEFTIHPAGSTFRDVTTTVEGLVTYNDHNIGVYLPDFDAEVLMMHPSRFTANTTESSWSKNIVTQFSESGEPEIVQLAPYYYMMDVGGWNQSQNDGEVTIIFPGVELTDYSAEVTYLGVFTDTNDDTFAVTEVKLGEDVEYAKVGIVAGNITQDALDCIIDETIESIEITASGNVHLPYTSDGRYTVIVVTYDADNEAQVFNYVSFLIISSEGGSTAFPIEDFYGDYIMTGFDALEEDEVEVTMSITIAPGEDPNTVIITGLQFADSVIATFPVKGFMSIAPQALPNFGRYDITMYNITPDWEVSDTDPMIFTRLGSGDIVLSGDSYAIGYLLESELAGGFVDGYFDISFSPVQVATSTTKNAVSSKLKAKSFDLGKAKDNIALKKTAKVGKTQRSPITYPVLLF